MKLAAPVDACASFPCQNGGTCSSDGSVYICTCPDTTEGSNCETVRPDCTSVACSRNQVCDTESAMCECAPGRTNVNGVCKRTTVFVVAIVILQIDGDDSSFNEVVNNPNSEVAQATRNRITLSLTAIFAQRYGNIFLAVIIRAVRLGSLEVDFEIQFDNETSSTITPTTDNIVETFVNSSESENNTVSGLSFNPEATTATDINECLDTTTNDCSLNALCTNTMGSFTCACESGFADTDADPGTTCDDIDECSDSNTCGDQAMCTNTVGGFTCACADGYTGDGQDCRIIGEGVLSDGALAGLIIGCVAIFFVLIVLVLAACFVMHKLQLKVRSVSQLREYDTYMNGDGARPWGKMSGIDYGDDYGDDYMSPDMELGYIGQPVYNDGTFLHAKTSGRSIGQYDNPEFSRAYVATGNEIDS